MNDLLINAPYKDTACPHCNTLNFHPTLVTKTDTVRDYSYTTAPVPSHLAGGNVAAHSPLKIGDSFEVMKNKMEKLNTSPNTITEGAVEDSPVKTLFPDSARGETPPRGIAMNKTTSSTSDHCDPHRNLATAFVDDIFTSREQLPDTEDNQDNNISSFAASFVHGIFHPQSGRDSERRRSSGRIVPLDINSESFDNVSIDGALSHRDNSSRQVLAQ